MSFILFRRALFAGWLGGLAGNALLGLAFTSSVAKALLYDPGLQSEIFLKLTPQRDIPVSVAGLVLLSGIHGLLYARFATAMPGGSTLQRGLWWGLMLWAMYWLPQEWFIYITLLREPLSLALVELAILLAGSLLEGVVIARLVPATS